MVTKTKEEMYHDLVNMVGEYSKQHGIIGDIDAENDQVIVILQLGTTLACLYRTPPEEFMAAMALLYTATSRAMEGVLAARAASATPSTPVVGVADDSASPVDADLLPGSFDPTKAN